MERLRDIRIKAIIDDMGMIRKMDDETFKTWLRTSEDGDVLSSPNTKETLNLIKRLEEFGNMENFVYLCYKELDKYKNR